jgi:hypothetical protein
MPFRVEVHVTHLPLVEVWDHEVSLGEAFGYAGFDVHLRWGDAQLDYLPAANPADEALWPNCHIPARSYLPGDASLLFACIQEVGANVVSTFTGAILEFEFQCLAPGTTTIELVPRSGIPATHFRDATTNQIHPDLANATITCG